MLDWLRNANRWYDDLDKTNPDLRFMIFFVPTAFLASTPLIFLVIGWEPIIAQMGMITIFMVLILMRLWWFKSNK